MEKSGPDVQNEKLLALLKELASLQIKEMQVGAASFVKKTGRTISESVEELKKYLEEQSKIYKQSRTDIDEVVERYKGDLADARKLYKDEKRHLIEEKSEWEDSLTESRAEYAEKKQEFIGMPGYKQFIEKRQEIARLEQQGKKEEAAKKREEFTEYKASLAKQEKALKIGMSLSIEQGNTIRIKEMAENLEAIQEQMVLAERDTELATIRSKMGMHKREIANLEKQIENCETNFKTEVENVFDTGRGINEEVVQLISKMKNEPEWMREIRLKALEAYNILEMPTWGPDLSELKMDEIATYVKPKTKLNSNTNYDMCIDEMLFKIWEEIDENNSRS